MAAVHGGADDAGEDEFELGLPMQHAGVVEFLREQDREFVGELIGTQVMFDGRAAPVSACAEPGRAHHIGGPGGCGAIRRDGAPARPEPLHMPAVACAKGSSMMVVLQVSDLR